ncbi:FtsH protease activity modulator HflK [Rickettsiales endosymbiont of Peranema trichophorum]|nr:FtsH protease activity modulator HflK [Rickettsiales endosymbiont of Peranema trichophorum]
MSDFHNPWSDKGRSNDSSNKSGLDQLIKKSQSKVANFINAKRKVFESGPDMGGRASLSAPPKKFYVGAALVLFITWLCTGFYTVQPDEEGVVLRFGSYSRTSVPGLNYKLPGPIESVIKVSVTRVNREIIGFRSTSADNPSIIFLRSSSNAQQDTNKIQSVPEESQMLTGDQNIVDIKLEVQWRITNAKDYLFNFRDLSTENTVKSCAESAMREVIGVHSISSVLADGRFQIEQQAKQLLQSILDSYQIGIHVDRLQMLAVQPPPEVIDAYRDVQSAKADKEKIINEAEAYRNAVIPEARGQAQQFIEEAEGYKQQVVANAKGEASRFVSVYQQYQKSKEITRKRMYLEAMEKILFGVNKIIIDNKISGNTVPYLSLQELMKQKNQDAPQLNVMSGVRNKVDSK